ncbi:MAG: zinc-ribbon domain-containing protein, partial [Acidobacteria bacterium]|nr:zinc-ribbon domain-containing protein [Acidobacteriota bacterium]
MIYCVRCGKENLDEARSCTNCGARFDERGEASPFVTRRLDE